MPTAVVSGDRTAVPGDDRVRVMTMHRAKGLEFSGVVIILNEDKWPPRSAAAASLSVDEKKTALDRGKQLLYVAMTRAVAHVALTGVGPKPEGL